jgi:hypothetical protein
MTTYRVITISGTTRDYEADNVEYQENGVELQAVGPLFRETVAFIPYMNLDGIEVVSE